MIHGTQLVRKRHYFNYFTFRNNKNNIQLVHAVSTCNWRVYVLLVLLSMLFFLATAVAQPTCFLSYSTDSFISQYFVSILLLLSLFHVKDSCLFLFNVIKLNKWDGQEEGGVEYFGDIQRSYPDKDDGLSVFHLYSIVINEQCEVRARICPIISVVFFPV